MVTAITKLNLKKDSNNEELTIQIGGQGEGKLV